MKSSSRSFACKALPLAFSIAAIIPQLHAATIVKENNVNALNLTTSWVGGVVPTNADTAEWNSTVLVANTTAALGGNADWLGMRVVSPGGAITVTHAAGQSLTIGSGGIDLSTATQNLTLLSTTNVAGDIAIGASQTWNVGAGRTLQLFSNSNTANQRLTGSGNIEVTGGGIVRLLTGDAGSTTFTAGNGNDTFTGNWTISNGSVRGLRNGTHAWGQGAIFMNGGTIGQEQGSWTWTNNIVLNAATTSTIDDFNTSGTTRSLKLQGVLSGSGNLVFAETGAGGQSNETGYILTNTNTLSGTVTINSPAVLRIGGVGGNDTTTGAGTTGTLGTASVVNNGTLVLARTNTWEFANAISGTGLVRIGLTSTPASHILTLSGNNSHTGGTTIQTALTLRIAHANALGTGAFTIGGNGIFDNVTGGPLTLGNAFTLSGGSPTFNGTNDMTFTGAVSLAAANRTITVNGGTLALTNNISQDATARNFTKQGVGTLVMGGTNSYTGTTLVSAGTLNLDYGTNDTTKLADAAALTLGSASIVLSGASGSHNEIVLSTTINGMALIRRSGTNAAEISLGAITRSTGGFLDVESANLVNTTTTNLNGIIQGVTLGGANLAANDGSNNVVAFTGYSDVTRLESGTKTISDGATQQIRIVDGSGSAPANITLAAAGTTNINSFVNSSTGGATTVTVGTGNTLRLGAAGAVLAGAGTAGVAITDGTLTVGGADNTAGDLLLSNSGATMIVSSAVSNNGTGNVTVTKAGTGTAVLSGLNTYTGATVIRTGILEVTGGSAIPDAGAVTIFTGGGLKLSANETMGALTGGGLNGTVEVGTFTLGISYTGTGSILRAAISGTGEIVKSGTGEIALEGNNPFSGKYTVNDGTVAFRTTTSENGKPKISLSGAGSLAIGNDFVGTSATISELSGSGTGTVNPQFDQQFGIRTLEVEQATNTVFSPVLRDGDANRILGLTKSGAGTLELSGANTYTGPTTVNGGTLLVSGSLSGSSVVTVNGGTLAGDGPVGAVTLNAGGTVAPGASPAILAAGNLNFNGGTLALELNGITAGTDYDQLSATGSVAFSANTPLTLSLGFDPVDGVDAFTIVSNDLADSVNTAGGLFSFGGTPLAQGATFTASGQAFSISYTGGDGNDVVLTAVPEPASIAMLLGGLGILGARRRSR